MEFGSISEGGLCFLSLILFAQPRFLDGADRGQNVGCSATVTLGGQQHLLLFDGHRHGCQLSGPHAAHGLAH